jgi:GAF domain-containing protein/nitrogen-specific signal transduction histidine kinase
MTAPSDDTSTDLHAVIAALRAERDAALAREARRDTDYTERAAHQAATVEVLQAMAVSLGDPKPVFEVIVSRARDLCDASGATLAQVVDCSIVLRAYVIADEAAAKRHEANFPRPVAADTMFGRAILAREPVQLADVAADQTYALREGTLRGDVRAQAAVPLMRDGEAIGAINITRRQSGEFSPAQIELLQVFANQAVIAITSAETYRALQGRTADLQESLDYQTATSEVLKVISRTGFDLHPMLATVAETAAKLCDADMAAIGRPDGDLWGMAASFGYPKEFEAYQWARGAYPLGPDSPTVAAKAIHHRSAVQIHDVTLVPDYPEIFTRLGRQRTSLGVPLLRNGEAIGFIALARQRVEPFTERQIELVRTFADQAVIAMENTRLLTEQREALEQQTATAEVLQVINASPGNLTPVFDTMLEKAMRLCGAAIGAIYRYNGQSFDAMALRGVTPSFAAFSAENPMPITAGGPPSVVLETKHPVMVADIAATDRYRDGTSAYARALLDIGGIRAALNVPLLKDGTVLGLITIYRAEPGAFSDKQITLLESFAAQAVIAMENARLINEQREALEQQTATAEVLQVINASPGNLAPVFDIILDKAMRLCDAAFGSLYTYDGRGFQSAAHRGVPRSYAEWRAIVPPSPRTAVPARILEAKRSVHVVDVMQEEDYIAGDVVLHNMVELGGIRTALSVPLLKDDVVLGFITIFRQEVQAFSDKQIELLENFAAQAVIAMENARLLNEVRQRQEELRITFDNMGDGVAMFDETQHLVAWNGKFQEIFDLPDALLNQHRTYEEHLSFLAARGDFGTGIDTTEQIHELVATAGQPYGYERTRPDGRVIEIRRNPVPDGGFVLIFSDITERKRSEAEIRAARDAAEAAYRDLKAAQTSLIQAEKMASLGQLTAGIAHEIKNPLNFVNNFAELSVDLLDELNEAVADNRQAEVEELTGTLKGNLGKIAEHGKRADGIVRGMLEHSRGSSGEQRSVDLNVLVEEALNLAYHGARAQDQSFNVVIKRELGEGISPITLAPQDVTRVLLNLLSNGFYAARERQRMEKMSNFEPALKVSTRELGDAVEIRVRDNGIGIPSDIKDRLFQPFFTTKPPGEGTGLGLSMSYDIITQQHGGSISVDSKVGEYSEFTVRLPRSP